MDADNTRYVCPRPRVVRACTSCKVHKTRCLSSTRSGQCRRCEKIGTICLFNEPTQMRSKPRTEQSENQDSTLNSILARVAPSSSNGESLEYEDPSETVVQLHSKVLGSSSPTELVVTTPQSSTGSGPDQNCSLAKTTRHCVTMPHVTRSQIEGMIRDYHSRSAWFPFADIAENATSEELCREWPFLLLSIILVGSNSNLILQKFLDERFRKVLATRIVMQGEKSIDYLRGLLVYLAWHPTHFRPMNNQIFQYMQLAVGMISDMDLERKMISTNEAPSDCIMARNCVLGCYYLSASFSMGFKRSKNFGYIPSNELLNSMLFPTSGSKENLAASAVTICKFIETIHGLDIQAEMARLSSWTECPLQTTTQAHLKELERIENEIPDNVRSNSKIQIMSRFARIKIHGLVVANEKQTVQTWINPYSPLEILTACASDINDLLEYIANKSDTDLKHFSDTDWALFIQTVIILPRICRFHIPDPSMVTTWRDTIAPHRLKFLNLVDQLCTRLESISSTKRGNGSNNPNNPLVPDLFFLFRTILGLFKTGFVRDSAQYDEVSRAAIFDENQVDNRKSRSRCPVINGDLRDTDYWTMWMDSNNLVNDDWPGFSDFQVNDPSLFDFDSWIDFSA